MKTAQVNEVRDPQRKFAEHEPSIPLEPGVRVARIIYIVLAWAFVGCITVQVFLAGMGVFMSPRYFQNHASFVHLFEWIPVFMLVSAFAGRLSRGLRWKTVGLWGLIAVQYATANFRFYDLSWALAFSSIHPVTALGLFWASIAILSRARREAAGSRSAAGVS